jgi:hypothetical protein
MRIIEMIKAGKQAVPEEQSEDEQYIRYEGEHILARLEKGRWISIRNKDNICSATIARNRRPRGASDVWRLFLSEVQKSDSFEVAVDFFERHGITMNVSG